MGIVGVRGGTHAGDGHRDYAQRRAGTGWGRGPWREEASSERSVLLLLGQEGVALDEAMFPFGALAQQ